MDKRMQIDKTRAAIIGILALTGTKVLRTKLVKLVYMADNRFYEFTGRTITGNLYMWDHFGPNAVGNAIANEANELSRQSKVRMSVHPSMVDGDSYEYWVDDADTSWEAVESLLDEGERQIIVDVTREFGRQGINTLVKKSRETSPFHNAQQYDLLQFEQLDRSIRMKEKVDSEGDFLEEVEIALKEADEDQWIWDDEPGH